MERTNVWEETGNVPADEETTRKARALLGLEGSVDPEIVEQLRVVPIDNFKAGLRLFMLWSQAEGKTSRELRERFSMARTMELPLDSYSDLNAGDLGNYFGRYALAMEFVARERCLEDLNGILEEQKRFQYIR